jgi:hypothetical protein
MSYIANQGITDLLTNRILYDMTLNLKIEETDVRDESGNLLAKIDKMGRSSSTSSSISLYDTSDRKQYAKTGTNSIGPKGLSISLD